MSDNENRQSTARKHTTTACKPCRDSKIKCDGKRPTCGICSTKNRHCVYGIGIDKRKLSLRKAVEVFSRRVTQLETCLSRHGIDVPEPAPDDNSMLQWLMEWYGPPPVKPIETAPPVMEKKSEPLADIDVPSMGTESVEISDYPSHSFPGEQMSGHLSHSLDIGYGPHVPEPFLPSPMPAWDLDADFIWYMSTLPSLPADVHDTLSSSVNSSYMDYSPSAPELQCNVPVPPASIIAPEDGDEDTEEDTGEVTSQFSDRLGTLLATPTGGWRFYGATSNLHLVHGWLGDHPSNPTRKKHDAQGCLALAGVDLPIDESLIAHLISLYFTWQNPSLFVVDQAAFETARKGYLDEQKESGFYSDLLLNAICAVGATFERNKHPTLPAPLTEFFASRSKSLLELELDNPRLSTVQALAILSIHEGATTRDTQGWLYSGMAVRLAFDLGLHIDPTTYVASGEMSAEEARVRSVTFWGTFATDQMWGFYLGRPFHSNIENVTLSRPSDYTSNTPTGYDGFWTPYGTPAPEKELLPNAQAQVSGRWVALYEIMSDLGYQMYCKSNVSKIELQALAEKTFNEMVEWKSSLPPELAVNMNDVTSGLYLPHTLIMHMQYAFCLITLHRPFVAKHYLQPYPRIGAGPEHARAMCVQSAKEIAILIQEYERRYSLRRANVLVVHMAFNAALILVYATISEMDRHAHQHLSFHLDICCHALAELGNVYSSASRTLEILLSVKRMWQARLVGSNRRKRAFGEAGTSKRKKQRSS